MLEFPLKDNFHEKNLELILTPYHTLTTEAQTYDPKP